MEIKHKSAVIFVGLLSAISLGMIASRFDPEVATGFVKFLFFISLFFTVWGIGSFAFSFIGKPKLSRVLRRGFLVASYFLALIILRRLSNSSVLGIVIVSIVFVATEAAIFYLFDKRN